MRLSEDFTVLASFDPGTFLLRFNIDPGIDPLDDAAPRFSPEHFIRKNPVSLTSHEFSHFVQGCATASGIREFFTAVDLAQLGYFALEAAARACNGHLTAPVINNKELYLSSDDFRTCLASYLVIARTCLLYFGGQKTPRDQKHDGGNWLKIEDDVTVVGKRVGPPLFFADLKWISAEPRLVLLGSLHLSEAFAKAIEMVQRHLTGEPGMRADPLAAPRDANPTQFPLANPYFLAHWIYGNFMRTLPKDAFERACVEELCAIIDLSFMVDPIVTATLSERQGEFGAFWANQRFDYSPIHAFMMFLSVFVTHHSDIPRFDTTWRQEHVTRFQNALLQKAGFSLSMRDLTMATIGWLEEAFALAEKNHFFIFPSLAPHYRDTFMWFLRWRAETLNGGAVLEDFLTGADKLYEFVLGTVPAFALGSLMVSTRAEIRPGEGVGVDIGNLHQYRNVIQTLLSGNVSCPLHTTVPRGCAVAPHEYCSALPETLSGQNRCTRETSLNGLLKNLGVKRLTWKP